MYNKKTLSKATAELDKAKAPKKPKDIITDPMGQWKYPGLPTRIPGNDITMKGVGYPVLGVANNGQRKIMLPGADYTFPGAEYVDEYPQMKKGGTKKKRKTKSIMGMNKLMQKGPLFQDYSKRIYDPNVDYFQDGGFSLGMHASPEMGNTIEPSLNYDNGNFSASASSNLPVGSLKDFSKNLNLSARYKKDLGKLGDIEVSGNRSFYEGEKPDYNMSVNYNKQFKNGLGINIKGDSPLKNIRNNGNASVGLTYTFQDGGFKTKLSKEEEKEFQKFYETLPENLQSDDPTYDIRGYWNSEGNPSTFNYDQPKEDDGYYHAYSVNQNTGEYLKSPAHPTFAHAVEEDKKMGYKPSFNIRSGKWESEEVSPEYQVGGPQNMVGPVNEDNSIYYDENIMNEDTPLSSSPSYRAYTMGKTGAYDEVTKRMGEVYEGTPDERLTIKSDPKTGYNYFLNPETGKEFEPLDYNGSNSDNLQRFLINVNQGEEQTKDFYSKTDKEGNLMKGHIPHQGYNTEKDTQQNIFKDLYTQNLYKYGNKDRAYYKATEAMKNVIEPQFKGSSYEITKTKDFQDKLAFNKNKTKSLSDIKNIYEQEAINKVAKDLLKKYGSYSEARNKVSNEELESLGKNSEYYKNKTKDLEKTYKDYLDKKNLLKNAEFEQGGYIETELTKNEIDQYRKGGYIVEDISIPELNQTQKGGTKTHKSVDGTTTNTITKANGDVIIQVKTKDGKYTEKMIPAAQQKAWDKLGKKLTIPNQKIPESMSEAQQMMDSGELDYETWNERKARNQREAEAHKQERLNALAKNEARYMDPRYSQLTGLPGESWRDKLANDVGATGAKFRVSQEDNFFDDYINPAVMIGSMAQSLGEAPKKAKESDSYMPYLTSIGSPLLAGAFAGIGAKNSKQFINNVVNPLAGVGTKTIKKAGKIIKPIGEGAYHFSKNMAESFTPNIIKKYGAKIEKIIDVTKNELIKKQSDLSDKINPLNNKIESLYYQLKTKVPANKKPLNDVFLNQKKLFNELRKAEAAKKELLLENDMLIQDVKNSAYERLGTMKSTVQDDAKKNIDYIYDFETGEKVPFNIKTPSVKSTVKLENRKPALSTEYSSDFEFGQDYAKTNTKNKEFVQKVLPGSKPFGSATFTDIGVAHASNDIDVAMTASDWEKVKGNVKLSEGKQAKYGPTINLGDEYGAQGNIDVNIVGENAKTKMAEGDFAKELYRQFFPDEFYRQQEELIEANLLNPKSLDKLQDIKINKTAKELIDAYDPKVKSILDAYETSPSVRGFGTSQTKVKQINRIDYILEQATDLKTVEKAQELFAKSIIGNKASVGYKFHPDQLSDVVENLQVLKKIGLTDNHNLIKIALDPKRMQLFLNDFYINKSIYNRELSISDHIKNVDDVVNASKTWKGYGESAMGMGTNATQLGHPSHASKFNDVTSNIYYDLIKGKTYNSPTEYVDNIINQTSGSRKFNDNEIIKLNDIAKKHGLEFDENKKINTLGDLLDDYRFKNVELYTEKDLTSNMPRRYTKQFAKQIESFYKEIGKELGAKAIQRGQYGRDADYATLLNNFDEELDKVTAGFNRDVPVLKSRSERMNNMTDAYQDSFKLNENEYYKLKYYLEGGVEELEKKKIALVDLEKSLQDRIHQTAKNNIRKNSKYDELKAEYDKVSKEIKINTETVNKLRKRQNKIEQIRPPMITIGALAVGIPATIAGTKAYLKKDVENTRNKKQLEVDLLNQEEAKTGKLSEEKLKHRKNLKSWIQSFDQPEHRKIVHQARKVFKEGGVVTKLTPKEIQEYINQGYIVEEH
jgi:hypothetical protein